MHRALLAALLLPLALAGCAADDPAASPTSTPTATATPTMNASAPLALAVSTSGAHPVNPGFSPATLAATAGANVTLTFTNAEAAPVMNHDWVLEGVEGAATEVIGGGESTEISFIAPPAGEYVYFCSVPGHRDRGMEGTMTVT